MQKLNKNVSLQAQNQRFGNVFVAQLVEQLTLNQWVQGSSPCEDTIFNCDPNSQKGSYGNQKSNQTKSPTTF